MTANKAGRAAVSGISSGFFKALVLLGGLGLAGCADVDSMLFGDSSSEPETPATYTANNTAAPAPAYTAPATSEAQSTAMGTAATITPVTIEPGNDSGTAVSKTIASLRSQVSALQGSLMGNAQRYSDLRTSGASAATAYHEARARITTRLQMGTTRGNPELVSEWNRAQSALDQMAGNINGFNALGASVASDASTAHYSLDQIGATFNVSGAVDEDHRQLSVLQDETNQSIVLIDRLLTEVSADVQRQTAYVANERANLTTLASAIKNGELYGADLASPMMAATGNGAPRTSNFTYSGTPLVVIRFDHSDVDYQQILYAALTQALQTRPGAAFSIVAVSPTRGTATSVSLAQTAAHRHAQDVMRSMTDMGVPASRLAVASATDPGVTSSEVRVFVR
jgi:hypothetical protein